MTKINIKDIKTFKNHPFKVEDDESLKELAESIKMFGLINSVIVRKIDNKYEMVSGHRRLKAIEILGKEEIEADIRELNDDEATILMVDSNIQRDKILPSEKAFAYKMKLDAIKHQGKITSATRLQKSRDEIANNESGEMVRRYIRLTYLIPELLQLVDDTVRYGKNQVLTMGIKPAVELSYLSKEEQKLVYAEIDYEEVTPSHAQAIRIRELSKNKELTADSLEKILDEKKGNQNDKISFNKDKIISVLPYEMSKKDKRYIEQYIIKAIENYKKVELERGDAHDLDI